MRANCTRCSARGSTLAPASISSTGPPSAGSVAATAGRSTPGTRSRPSRPAATTAPVGPIETHAAARPSRTAATARTSEAPGRPRTQPGSSSGPIASGACSTATPAGRRAARGRVDRRLVADQEQLELARHGSQARALDGRRRRPVAAHRVQGDPHRRHGVSALGLGVRRCGVLASAIRAADGAHPVRQLRRVAGRAGRRLRGLHAVLGAAAIATRLRRFLLGDGHRRGSIPNRSRRATHADVTPPTAGGGAPPSAGRGAPRARAGRR